MNPLQLEMAINALIILIQVIVSQLNTAENLTPEQKQAYIDRITSAQNSIQEWK